MYFEQLEEALFENDELKVRAQSNPIENFKYAFEEVFIQTLIDRMKDNEEIFDKIMENNEFKTDVKDWLTKKIYHQFNDKQGEARCFRVRVYRLSLFHN